MVVIDAAVWLCVVSGWSCVEVDVVVSWVCVDGDDVTWIVIFCGTSFE